jgi:hypothetical protein
VRHRFESLIPVDEASGAPARCATDSAWPENDAAHGEVDSSTVALREAMRRLDACRAVTSLGLV